MLATSVLSAENVWRKACCSLLDRSVCATVVTYDVANLSSGDAHAFGTCCAGTLVAFAGTMNFVKAVCAPVLPHIKHIRLANGYSTLACQNGTAYRYRSAGEVCATSSATVSVKC